MANFRISGQEIKNPSGFKIEDYDITTLERLASAKMVGDLVARKRKFYFTYGIISSIELNKIIAAIRAGGLFFTLDYIEDEVPKQATVYAGAIPKDLHRADTKVWQWKNVSFSLIEQ